jgi:hypothetical protein
MKYYLFTIIVSFALQAFCVSLETQKLNFEGFERKKDNTWVSKKDANHVIVVRDMSDSYFDLKESGVKSYVTKQAEVRSLVNYFAGITSWTVQSSKFDKVQDQSRLRMSGEFVGHDVKNYFVEEQIFIKPKVFQVKISALDATKLDDQKVQTLMSNVYAEIK